MTSGEQNIEGLEQQVRIKPDRCVACGLCLLIAPDIFQPGVVTNETVVHQDGIEQPDGRLVNGEELPLATEAAKECPSGAITVETV